MEVCDEEPEVHVHATLTEDDLTHCTRTYVAQDRQVVGNWSH